MIITYLRSSSINEFRLCPQKYYIGYVLGKESQAGIAAEKGTITHKVLEYLAQAKQQVQLTGGFDIQDNITSLHGDDVFKIDIGELIHNCYTYYVNRSRHSYSKYDLRDVQKHVETATTLYDGLYDPRNRTIVEPEQHFQLPIEKPWANYEYLIKGEKVSGILNIKGTIDLITEVDKNTAEVIDWKGLTLDTLLPTINGFTTMAEVKIGDVLFDKDGNQTKVLAKSRVKTRPSYKIIFDDTSYVVCDDEHLWLLKNDKVCNTLNLHTGDKIPITKPIDLEEKDLPIDPYLLGIWLGDGKNRNAEICGSDSFIFDELRYRGHKLGKNLTPNKDLLTHTVFNTTSKLRKLKLLHNKHIPEIYLTSSYKQRLELLRGLMDSDGNVNQIRKQCIFTNCTLQLSKDVKRLLLSLGQRPLLSKVKCKGFGLVVDCYPVSFRPININPFLLPRKKEKVLDWGVGHSNFRIIKKIEYIGEKETQCIKVDSPSSTYLCTENFIPTHNTGASRKCWVTDKVKNIPEFQEDVQLMLYYYAARRILPQYKNIIFTIFFTQAGGPFTVFFNDSHMQVVEDRLKQYFTEIRNTVKPRLLSETQSHFKCRFCTYKNGTCKEIQDSINTIGLAATTDKYLQEGHSISMYKSPGE